MAALAVPAGASARAGHGPHAGVRSHRPILGVVPTRARQRARARHRGARAADVQPLIWGGGPVMHANRVHAIYWFPPGYTLAPSYRSVIDQYLSDVAHDSGSEGNVYSTDPQYTDSSANAAYSSTAATSIVDPQPFPASGCSDPKTSACVSDSQIVSEVNRVVSTGGLPRGLGDIYFVFTPPNVGSCDSSGACSFVDFCAYHSGFGGGSSVTLYANMPYGAFDTQQGCGRSNSLNGDPAADVEVNLVSHEHNETVTDPLGDAWLDVQGNEDGDKCAYVYGTTSGTPGAEYNQTINGRHYLLQEEWSNHQGGCVQDATQTVSGGGTPVSAPPTASIAPVGVGRPGIPVTLSAGPSAGGAGHGLVGFTWSFDDGATATGTTVSHAFSSPGVHTVSVRVIQDDGEAASATARVTIAGPPRASFSGPAAATVGRPVSFDATASSDPYAPIPFTGYWWSFGDGSGAVGPTTGHAFTAPGTYRITLTVANVDGEASFSETVAVAVAPAAPRPPRRSAATVSLTVLTRTLRSVLSRGLGLSVAGASGPIAAVVRLDAATARRAGLGSGPVVVGRARTRRGGSLVVHLRPRAGAALAGLRHAAVLVTVTTRRGASVQTTTRRVVLGR